MTNETLLEVDGLQKYFSQNTSILDAILRRNQGQIQAVDGVSFEIQSNDIVGIIGESGCGKSTLLWTLMGLHDATDGEIRYRGDALDSFTRHGWKDYRSDVQMIFQDPFTSLDPKMTVRESLMEPLKIHGRDQQTDRVREVLKDVELEPVDRYLDRLPDQLSGGEKQRVCIARSLILEPELLLADEPLSMLDVSTQAAILNLLLRLADEREFSMIYVSHDISTVSYLCDSIHVMYLGRIIETGPVHQILDAPKHPYTQALIRAIPLPDPYADRERSNLSNQPQTPIDLGEGCRFRDRCPDRMDICERTPKTVEEDDDHRVACHLYYDHEDDEAPAVPPVSGGDQ